MTKDKALKMAIKAFEPEESTWWSHTKMAKAYQACKEALEQPNLTYEDGFAHGYEAHRAEQALEQPAQEPVAFRHKTTGEFCTGGFELKHLDQWTPLYTNPAPSWQGNKEFVGLSDDERFIIVQNADWDNPYDIAELIEQALKDKNS